MFAVLFHFINTNNNTNHDHYLSYHSASTLLTAPFWVIHDHCRLNLPDLATAGGDRSRSESRVTQEKGFFPITPKRRRQKEKAKHNGREAHGVVHCSSSLESRCSQCSKTSVSCTIHRNRTQVEAVFGLVNFLLVRYFEPLQTGQTSLISPSNTRGERASCICKGC